MEKRIYDHMKNTLRDIKILLNDKSMNDMQKIEKIRFSLSFLESLECGTTITSDLT